MSPREALKLGRTIKWRRVCGYGSKLWIQQDSVFLTTFGQGHDSPWKHGEKLLKAVIMWQLFMWTSTSTESVIYQSQLPFIDECFCSITAKDTTNQFPWHQRESGTKGPSNSHQRLTKTIAAPSGKEENGYNSHSFKNPA